MKVERLETSGESSSPALTLRDVLTLGASRLVSEVRGLKDSRTSRAVTTAAALMMLAASCEAADAQIPTTANESKETPPVTATLPAAAPTEAATPTATPTETPTPRPTETPTPTPTPAPDLISADTRQIEALPIGGAAATMELVRESGGSLVRASNDRELQRIIDLRSFEFVTAEGEDTQVLAKFRDNNGESYFMFTLFPKTIIRQGEVLEGEFNPQKGLFEYELSGGEKIFFNPWVEAGLVEEGNSLLLVWDQGALNYKYLVIKEGDVRILDPFIEGAEDARVDFETGELVIQEKDGSVVKLKLFEPLTKEGVGFYAEEELVELGYAPDSRNREGVEVVKLPNGGEKWRVGLLEWETTPELMRELSRRGLGLSIYLNEEVRRAKEKFSGVGEFIHANNMGISKQEFRRLLEDKAIPLWYDFVDAEGNLLGRVNARLPVRIIAESSGKALSGKVQDFGQPGVMTTRVLVDENGGLNVSVAPYPLVIDDNVDSFIASYGCQIASSRKLRRKMTDNQYRSLLEGWVLRNCDEVFMDFDPGTSKIYYLVTLR